MYRFHNLDELYNEFVHQRKNFSAVIGGLFDKAKLIDQFEGLQNLFMKILSNSRVSITEYLQMINLGADYTAGKFMAFDIVAMTNQVELARYMLAEYDIDIQYHQKSLTKCINGMKMDTFRIVYPDLESITDNIIFECLEDVEKVKLLVSYGIDIAKIINNCTNNYILSLNFISTAEYLIQVIIENPPEVPYDGKILADILSIILRKGTLKIESLQHIMRTDLCLNIDNNRLYLNACSNNKNFEIVSYFINESLCDINTDNGRALVAALGNGASAIVKLLLDNDIIITDIAIKSAVNHYPEFLPLLYQYGAPIDRIKDLLIETFYEYDRHKLASLKFLAENLVDLNHVVLNANPSSEKINQF